MKVLVGTDDSPFSHEAVDYVRKATWPKGVEFLVVSAAAPVFIGPGEATAPDAISRLMAEQEKYHREIAERDAARLREDGLNAEPLMVIGDPRSTLVETAGSRQIDLIVVGSHGRTGIKRLLLGSVASYVVGHAPCSVLVVRSKARHA